MAKHQIDYRNGAAAYDGFEDWSIGTIDLRRLLSRFELDTSAELAHVSAFTTTMDVEERTEKGEDVAVPQGGTNVIFAQRFHKKPNVQVTVDESSGSPSEALFPMKSLVSATGFAVRVFDSNGIDVGGVVDWRAIGA